MSMILAIIFLLLAIIIFSLFLVGILPDLTKFYPS